MNRKKKGKYIGLAGALLVHVVVIALLILVGFTLPEQSEEGGVPVMMGEMPDAWGAADPSLVEVETMPEETAPEMPEEAEQEMLTQEDEETVAIKPKAEEKKKEVKKPEKSAAGKAEEARKLAAEKAERERKAAEEAARKRYPLKSRFNSEFNDKDVELTSVWVSPYSSYIGKSLDELPFRREFGVNIVSIVRGERRIYIPQSSERIYPQDKLVVVGTGGQLQEFRTELENRQDLPDEKNIKQDVTLHSFTVDEDFPFLNKSIAQSRLGKRYDSLVVALEREGELVPVNQATVFQLGDLVWVVGDREKIRQFLVRKK